MPQQTFKGLCVGGPLDGQHVTKLTSWLEVIQCEPVPVGTRSTDKVPNVPLKTVVYNWRNMVVGNELFGFWVIGNPQSASIMQTLIDNYRPQGPSDDV